MALCTFKLSEKSITKFSSVSQNCFHQHPIEFFVYGFSVPLHFVPDTFQAASWKVLYKNIPPFSPSSRSFQSVYTWGSRSTASQTRSCTNLFLAKSHISCSYSLSKPLHCTSAFYLIARFLWIQTPVPAILVPKH